MNAARTMLTQNLPAADAALDAFMDFYDRTCDDAYRLACLYTHDRRIAEDVVVRAYVHTWLMGEPDASRCRLFTAIRTEATPNLHKMTPTFHIL